LVHELLGHERDIESMAVSPIDSRIVATVSYDARVIVWDVIAGRALWEVALFYCYLSPVP
jgi:WD40 repeat protein